ncbi:glycosyltransferase involved in cell wall biosynthesis [Georgenia soli]|uniref:Glycosyltransferase involved in cell wall biosynthesis n=1 Tax=Georgenia soli TaxID=638953 RepID=A0A2A9EIC8_9MICO|nr:glycosyltransferase [Georgenia soli]PFG38684.1 glycosyltransferase involved in cell wall biosynthesis [Georgenia soli]
MRVVQVSAHFPPNFVSGGTLVPHRIADAVAKAGHESYVYAGHLDDSRTPLETWTDVLESGVTVRWIVTTPWTAWSDPRNSLNPDVEADFRNWLADTRPDVVHLHSLQTLGGSLVRAAKESGAQVVVTMHDFWWFCARQFLATSDYRPCSLVVDCGTCACAVDHSWLRARNDNLMPFLQYADAILAPSASAARVFIANGVPAEKVRVDENGLPDEVARRADPAGVPEAADGPLRLMFAGGADPMKGFDVLAEAVGDLTGIPGWRLDVYGVDRRPPGLPPQVRLQPAYRPEELSDVLSEHEILVLPSIMRESHSILTREALDAGLAVVCSDTLGPEEAVDHGRNGLVVPAGDAEALAAALRLLVSEPTAARMLTNQGSATPIRPFADQARGLVDLYAELALPAGDVEPEADDSLLRSAELQIMRRVVFVVGIQGAPLRYRAHLPAEALRMLGLEVEVRHYRDPELVTLVQRADAVVFYRVPATFQVLDLIDAIRRRERRIPVLYDVDDLIFDPNLKNEVHGLASLPQAEVDLWWHGVARYRTTMEATDMFIGSTAELCRHATATTGLPARRFNNGVGTLLAQASDDALRRTRAEGPLRIGYFSGTTTHDADWAAVEPSVLRVMRERPDIELWLGGHLQPTPALELVADRVKRLPFTPWLELPGLLRDVDVCLAPLTQDSRFNEAKSAIKWLEAALVETPVVASSTEPFREAIDSGRTGILAKTGDDWAAALFALLDDAALRRRMGTQARREALLRWSPHVQGPVYLANLLAAAEHVRLHGSRRRSTEWTEVADDEPLSAAEAFVEPYAVPGATSRLPGSLLRHPLMVKAATAHRVYRAGGTRAVLDKTVKTVRKRFG